MQRKFFLTVLTIAMSTTSIASAAEAIQDRYCLQGRVWGYPGNCQFSNYGQCMATASGTDSYCGINPMNAYAQGRNGYQRPR
jgi:hypothetical protein